MTASAQLLSAKVVIIEEAPAIRPVQAANPSIAAMLATMQRGPLTPQLTTGFDQVLKIYGDYSANTPDGLVAAKGFFDQGGQFLWVQRTVHYSDITNPNSKTSAAATGTLNTANLAATAGTVTGGSVAPFVLAPGDTFKVAIDGGGVQTATFTATAGHSDSAAGPTFVLSNAQTLTVAIDGGSVQTVTFSTSQFVSIGAATLAEVAAVLNAGLTGANATIVSNKVRITSDRLGSGSSVNVTGGAANGALGYSTGAQSGTGNVSNILAVTAAEVVAVLSGFTGCAVTNVSGAAKITSNTLGSSSSVQVSAAGTAQISTKLNFDTATHTGNSAGTLGTLTVTGKTDGAYGNATSVVVSAASNGQAAYFNLVVQFNGVLVETWPNLTMDATSTSYAPDVLNDVNTGSDYIALTDLLAATSAPNNRPASATVTLSGGSDGLASLSDNDYVGSQVANASAGTGLRAFDATPGIGILFVPGRATPVVHNAMITYCEATRFGSTFAVFDPPAGYSAAQMITYVSSTALLEELSEFGAIYWPRVKVGNPSTDAFGGGATITVPPSGHIVGAYCRNDASKPGGVYEAPAGVDFGKLSNVIGLETDEVKDESKRDLIVPHKINPIVGIDGLPIHIDGCECLMSTGNFPTIGERRGVIFIEQSLKQSTVFAKHRKIKNSLLKTLDRTVRAFLVLQMRDDAFASDDPKTAFSINFTGGNINPPSETFARRVNGRIGLATAKPAKFIILRVGQDTTALEAELAAA